MSGGYPQPENWVLAKGSMVRRGFPHLVLESLWKGKCLQKREDRRFVVYWEWIDCRNKISGRDLRSFFLFLIDSSLVKSTKDLFLVDASRRAVLVTRNRF